MRRRLRSAAAGLTACLMLASCAPPAEGGAAPGVSVAASALDDYLSVAGYATSNIDPQCNDESCLIALNVFDRLVETRRGPDGGARIVPSLAESWQVSDDGREYTFRLRRDVTFSNGAMLTAADVRYSLTRLLMNPESCYREIALPIRGAEEVMRGESATLRGVDIHHAYELTIRLTEAYAPFLAGLASPGASILDEGTTKKAGAVFGREPVCTVGTGPFTVAEWKPGLEMTLRANPDCWAGAPRCAGIRVHIVSDSESQRLLFEDGVLDILELDSLGADAEYYFRNEAYRDMLVRRPRVSLDFIVLNNAVPPFDDVRVRRAMQLALDRETLLTAVAGGRGDVENGLFPHGLNGHDPTLEAIPFDLERARGLMREAELADGFDLELTLPRSAPQSTRELLRMAAVMWEEIGVRAELVTVDDSVYSARRNAGALSCYAEHWLASYNDPDYFLDTYFGSVENTTRRSICYQNEAVMEQIRRARALRDETGRERVYHALQRTLVQEDAACIPLFSAQHSCLVSKRVEGFEMFWNGSSDSCYCNVALRG